MGFNPFEQIGSAAADAGKFLQDRGNDIAKAASEGANAVAKGAAEGAGAVVKAASEGADAVAKAASEGAEAAAKAVTSGANQVAEAAASIGKAPIWHQANHAITEDDDDLAAVFVDSSFDELKDKSEEQKAEAQKFLIDFMKKIIRLKGVRIDRAHFLRSELKKKGVSNFDVDFAVSTTPVTAGICESIIENVAKEVIDFETKKSTALSFAAGLPGGAAMAGTIPADITQYYVHAFRVMQKLAYLYGWQSFLDECDDVDDETLYEMGVLLGVMMGGSGREFLADRGCEKCSESRRKASRLSNTYEDGLVSSFEKVSGLYWNQSDQANRWQCCRQGRYWPGRRDFRHCNLRRTLRRFGASAKTA